MVDFFRKKRLPVLILTSVILLSLATALFFLFSVFSVSPVVKIGFVNPSTGVLAGNGEGCDWVIDQFYEYVRENPLVINGRKAELQIIVYDSRSDSEFCRLMTEKLVRDDKVDLLIAAQTPETVIPATSVAEDYHIPCISVQAPVDPLAHARKRYDWTYHAFWTIDSIYECYRGLWTKAGFPPHSGAKIGTLFANDEDGNEWHEIFVRRAREDGYQVVDPGQYQVRNKNFTGIAYTFAREKINILTGTNIPLDFMNALQALRDENVVLDCITMGKCCLMQSDVSAYGPAAIGLMSEVWWSTENGYVSELTKITSQELEEEYTKENFGNKMPQSAGFAYAAMELALHAIKNAASRDKKKILSAISKLNVDTVVGPVCYNKVMGGLHYSDTVVCGGQWQYVNGEFELKVIDNSLYPSLKVSAEYKSGNVTKDVWQGEMQ